MMTDRTTNYVPSGQLGEISGCISVRWWLPFPTQTLSSEPAWFYLCPPRLVRYGSPVWD